MTATVHPLAVISPAPRRSVRDQEESLTGYLARTGERPAAGAKTTARALVHYACEEASLKRDLAVAEIYAAGWAACEAALTETFRLRAVTLADVTSASVTALREA